MPYYCPTCAAMVRKKDVYCSSCGTQMSEGPIFAQSKADLIDIEDIQNPVSVQTVGDRQYEREVRYSDEFMQDDAHTTYQYTQNNYYQDSQPQYKQYFPLRNKYVAAFLAFFFGTFGLHEYYLGHTGKGILMSCFFWTGIPTFMGLVQAIVYLTQGDEEFCFRNRVRVK